MLLACLLLGGIALPRAWGDSGGYANPEVESHFMGMVTIESNAILDPTGKPYYPLVAGEHLRFHSALYHLLVHTYVERGRAITFKTDPVSEGAYRKVVEEFPFFPFGYYALALTLRSRHDPGWRGYAQAAVGIFEKTTARPDCNPSHFSALKELREWLAQSAP